LTRGDAFTSSCGAARNPDPKAQWPRKRNYDATQAHRQRPPNFIAPFCGPGRRTALE